jgi:hypothetical protein
MASHDSIVVQEPKKIIEIIKELPSVLDKPGSAQNFYRLLSNDACHIRHLILEPDILEHNLPLDNEKDLSGVIGSLGPFSELPPEIVSMILMQVDIESLTKFRSVSRAARDAVDSLFKYRNIVTHAPQILRATLALKAGKYITLTHLDAALMSKVCQDCGEFGAFLHVPTCERVCYKCFTANEDRMPLSAPHVRHKWRLTKKEFAFWKEDNKIRTLPGRYRIKGKLHRVRTCYVSNEEALRAKIRISGKSREEVTK